MTALAAAYPRQARSDGRVILVPLTASATVFKGALVFVDTATGFGVDATDAASRICVGVALDDATGGSSAGDVSVEVECDREWLFVLSSITQAMLGDPMYCVDNNTLDDSAGATNDIFVGHLTEFISTTSGWVFIPGIVSYPTSAVTASASELNLLDASLTSGVHLGVASGTLLAAQVNDLKDTNVTAIATPGAGRAIIPLSISLFLDHGGVDFIQAAGTDHIALAYSGGVEIDEIGSEAQLTAFIEAGGDAAFTWPIGGIGWIPTANEAVVFDNNGATDMTTGDGVVDYYIIYAVVPVA